ncbi:MAG: Transposase [Candidatus Nitrosotenuis sp.]|nr:Transposase [Candidatus Nitrosotenuis sp.]
MIVYESVLKTTASHKKLSILTYNKLENHSIMSYYKLTAISQACGRLSQMKKDIRKGRKPKSPYIQNHTLCPTVDSKSMECFCHFPYGAGSFAILKVAHVKRWGEPERTGNPQSRCVKV